MYYLSPSPKLHFDDLNGNPLTGGKLKTYLAGSSTPVQTSQDFTGTSLNPTTVILDERGEAKIRLNPMIKYKFELYDSSDSYIYSVDNIGIDGAVTTSSITCSDGTVQINSTSNGVDLSIQDEVTERSSADTALSARITDLESVTYISPIKKENNQVQLEESGVTPNTYGDQAGSRTLAFGGTFKIPKFTVDKFGLMQNSEDVVLTMPSFSSLDTNYLIADSSTYQSVSSVPVTLSATASSSHGYSFVDNVLHIPYGTALTNVTVGLSLLELLNSVEYSEITLILFNETDSTTTTVGHCIYDYKPGYLSISLLIVGSGNFSIKASSPLTRSISMRLYVNDESQVNSNGGTDDHLVLASSTDVTPGNLFAKLTASGMTHLYDRGSTVEINSAPTIDSTLTGTGSTSSPLGLNNPLWYIKGNTVYGGTIVTDLNAITHTGFYTATGAATGTPNGSYSWFVFHQNSNAGTLYAQQTAYAYASTIICYERVKINNVWYSWTLRSSGGSDDHKLLVSATDSTPGYLFDKVESTTLTINYSVDGNGAQMLDMNVVNQASGYPNNYEPFFPSASFTKLGNEMYAGISSPNLTRGWFFAAPRSMKVANLGVYLKGEPSPSGIIQIELALKDVIGGNVKKTALLTLNTTNFINLSSGGIYSIPLTEPLSITGTYPYILYLMLKASDGTTQLSTVSNLEFMETCSSSYDSVQLESGVYSQYSSQNFEGYGDTSYANISCRPYLFISE